MKTLLKKGGALLSLLLISAMLLTAPAAASTAIPLQTETVKDLSVSKYSPVPVFHGSRRLSVDARLVGSTTYVPLRAFFEALYPDARVTYDVASKTAYAEGKDLSVSASVGSSVLYANGRCFYSASPILILSDGRLYVPIRSLAKTLELEVGWNASARSVVLSGTPKALKSASAVYKEEDLYWLSRIISAESRGEPLLGQIAVGNVVLNRVRSSAYPSTVKGVVFDKKYGVQFSPISDGSVYKEPTPTSVTAAKICLEGYTVSDKILFFFAPKVVSSSWISKNRPYAFTIANHRFYN